MRRPTLALLATATLSLGFTQIASAADLPVKAAPAAVAAPVYNWSGFYIGVSAGGAWSSIDGSFVFPPPATWSTNNSAGIFGGQVGFQWQFGNLVLGVEADGLGLSSNSFGTDSCHPAASCGAGLALQQRLSGGIFTVGPRLGWSLGAWMPYITGGYASGAKVDWNFVSAAGVVLEGNQTKHNGSYIGGGIDWMVAPNWVLGVEYRHYTFNSQTAIPVLAGGVANPLDTYSVKPKVDSVALRLSYLFGWPNAVVAKY